LALFLAECKDYVLLSFWNHTLCSYALVYISGAQTAARGPHVARKALWSGPRSNFHWKENVTLNNLTELRYRNVYLHK